MCRTIVLVDDSRFDNLYHALILERAAVAQRIVCFEDPEQGLEYLARATDVELVLLDLNMPAMTGWEFLDVLGEGIRPIPPVVILSSSSDPVDIARATAHPAVKGFVTKPLTEELLESVILSMSADTETPTW